MESYFTIIPEEIIDIIISKVNYNVEKIFIEAHPEVKLNHGHILRLRFPYLNSISNVKHDMYEDYITLSKYPDFYNLFVNGYRPYHFISIIFHTIYEFDIQQHEIRPAMVPIIIDAYSHRYPNVYAGLYSKLLKVKLPHFILGLHFIHPFILNEANHDVLGLNIYDIEDIVSVSEEFESYKEEYDRFIPGVDTNNLDILLGAIFHMVYDYHERYRTIVDPRIQPWSHRYIKLYKESMT